jgi:hypothetical protein
MGELLRPGTTRTLSIRGICWCCTKMISGDQFEGALMQGAPYIAFEKTALGIRYNLIKDLPNGNRFVRHAKCIVPNVFVDDHRLADHSHGAA